MKQEEFIYIVNDTAGVLSKRAEKTLEGFYNLIDTLGLMYGGEAVKTLEKTSIEATLKSIESELYKIVEDSKDLELDLTEGEILDNLPNFKSSEDKLKFLFKFMEVGNYEGKQKLIDKINEL
jgi:hypothetical protein